MEKRGQLEMSFGMIFSIILIIAFLVFAFFAIQKFIAMQESIKLKQLSESIQNDVDKLWKSTQGSKTINYTVPKSVTSICFNEYSEQNLVINFKGGVEARTLLHFNSEGSLKGQRSICAKAINGKVKISYEKKYGDALVTVKI